MAYFTAAFTGSRSRWRPREVDIDGVVDLATLTDLMRSGVDDEATSLLLIEHEDEWFAVVRVDGEDDPRVFVSDAEGATHSPFAEMLVADGLPVDIEDEDLPAGLTAVGDPDILADLGMSAETLLDLCGDDGVLPIEATDAVANAVGFGDLLDSMR